MLQQAARSILDSYARQSYVKKKQRQRRGGRNMSIEGQHSVNILRIEEYGAVLGKKLQDEGKSAWDPTVQRRDWEELLRRVETGASNGVCIFDIERFLRRVKDAVRIVEMAEKGFIVLDSDQEFDLMTPSGREAFYNAATAAETYSHRLSTRVKRGYNLKIADGEWIGGRYRMFGFEEDSSTVRESEAAPIRRLAPQLLTGLRPIVLVGELNESGFRTGSGAPWNTKVFRQWILNPRVAGYIRRNGEIVGRLHGDPILDPSVWQNIVAWYGQRVGRPRSPNYLCSGGPVRCSCGGRINGCTDLNRAYKTYEDGEITRRYTCKREAGGCGRVVADQRVLDRHVSSLAVAALSSPDHIDQIRRRAAREEAQRAPVLAEIARLEGLIEYWGKRLNDGKITPETHDAFTDDLAEKIKARQGELATLAQVVDVPGAAESLADAKAMWDAADGDERRELLKRAFAGFVIQVDPGFVRDTDVRDRVRVIPAPSLGAAG